MLSLTVAAAGLGLGASTQCCRLAFERDAAAWPDASVRTPLLAAACGSGGGTGVGVRATRRRRLGTSVGASAVSTAALSAMGSLAAAASTPGGDRARPVSG